MPRNCLPLILLAGVFAFGSQVAAGQMIVHAVSGTVKTTNPTSKSIDVDIEDGSKGHFKISSGKSVPLSFDDDLRKDSVSPSSTEVGSFVVVYYYGFGDDRTAVAIKDLGKGPFDKVNGKVVAFDKHGQILTVLTGKAEILKFQLSEKAVVDSGLSVESGKKYNPGKGYTVRVTATGQSGKQTAVFIRSRR